MGIMDKITFWKKKDEDFPDLGPLPGDMPTGIDQPIPEFNPQQQFDQQQYGQQQPQFGQKQQPYEQQEMPEMGHEPLMPETRVTPTQQGPEILQQRPATMQPTTLEPKQDFLINKDLEIISAKLDTLKASLDNINQRLSMLERFAEQGQFKRSQW